MSKYLKLTILFLILSNIIFAQGTTKITGLVTDNSGAAVAGATVKVISTNNVSITDQSGNFSVNASPTDVLEVSYVGLATKSITVGNQTFIAVTLAPGSQQLRRCSSNGLGYQTV